jgi:hypothetical protein
MAAPATHLRLAAVDGRKCRGVKAPALVITPVPRRLIDRAGHVVSHGERLARLLARISSAEFHDDPVVMSALAATAEMEASHMLTAARCVAEALNDPARW